jgi:hypothetical protein
MKKVLAGLFGMVAASSAAMAQDGVAKDAAEAAVGVPFQVRHGWFAETQVGVFSTLGGQKPFANGQPFIGLSLGLDLPNVEHLTVFGTIAQGASGSPDNLSLLPFELGARYGFGELAPRLTPHVLAVAGYSVITPSGAPDRGITETTGSVHAGGGFGLEYVTRLDGLTVGAEVVVRQAFAPFLTSLAAYPRIKYVF